MLWFNGHSSRYCWRKNHRSPTRRRDNEWDTTRTPFDTGARSGRRRNFGWKNCPGRDDRPLFPPKQIVQIKAVACELPAHRDQPLRRLFIPDIPRIVVAEKIVKSISRAEIWRILDEDALKPWRQRTWIYPRDPQFYERTAPVLDLYQGIWHGKPLGPRDHVLCADEKTGLQVLRRLHGTEIGKDRRGQRIEHEYVREWVWAYWAALDIFRAKVIGRVEETTGIVPFNRLMDQVMKREPYASARRVFWIVDGGSSHHRNTFPQRLRNRYPNAIAVMTPTHASWVNQIEIYFSILERKALTPKDFQSRDEAVDRIRAFEQVFNRTAEPFRWTYTRQDLREWWRRVQSGVEADVRRNLRKAS